MPHPRPAGRACKLASQSDYTDYSVAYDQAFGSGNYWRDSTGTPLAKPQQEIAGRDRFTKESNELRISSPNGDRFRLIAGLYQAHQTHLIIQDYQIAGFDPALSVPGHPGTIWLTRQSRVDRDQAVFAEATFDITDKISITAGVRGYHYHNTLYGFYGYGAGYNALTGFHSGQGVGGINCQAGKTFTDTPCVNLDKGISGSGETHKVNLTYKFDNNHLVYFTYSTGYRPGGVNRSGAFLPYQSDTLTNFELGWKTSWAQHRVHFNGAIYDEEWDKFQFSFLGPNSLTIVENAPQARIRGVETSLDWRASKNFTLSGGAAYNHGRLVKNFCGTDANAVVIPTCADIDAVALHGQQLPYTPSFKGNLTARFTFDLAGWDGHFQVSGLYQNQNGIGLRKGDLIFLTPIPGFASADFSLGAERGNLSLEMFVKNAFDTRGGLNRSTPCTVAVCAQSYPGVPAALYIVPIQPLTVGVKVGQKF